MVQNGDFENWIPEDKGRGPDAVREYPYSIVMSLHQDAANVPVIMARLLRFLRAAKWNAEVIVIDDGSKDDTAEACSRFRHQLENLSVIRHADRMGRGAAARTGVLLSSGKIVVVVDPRCDTPFEDAFELVRRIKRGSDLAIASRRVPGAAMDGSASFMERASETAFTALSRMLVPVEARDCGSELIVLRRRTARAVVQRSQIDGDVYVHEWLTLAERLGHLVDEVPVSCLGENAEVKRRSYNELAMLRDVVRMRMRLGRDDVPQAQTARDLLQSTSFKRFDRRSLGGARNYASRY